MGALFFSLNTQMRIRSHAQEKYHITERFLRHSGIVGPRHRIYNALCHHFALRRNHQENRITKRVLYMNLGTTRLRGRPRNRWQDEVREDGRIVGGEGWQEKVHDREEWKKLRRTARNRRILHMPMERMNEWRKEGTTKGQSGSRVTPELWSLTMEPAVCHLSGAMNLDFWKLCGPLH